NYTESSKDIIQELFINLWEKRKILRPKVPIKSYLIRDTINRSLNYLSSQSGKGKIVSLHLLKDQNILQQAQLPDNKLHHQKLYEYTQKVIQSLPHSVV